MMQKHCHLFWVKANLKWTELTCSDLSASANSGSIIKMKNIKKNIQVSSDVYRLL